MADTNKMNKTNKSNETNTNDMKQTNETMQREQGQQGQAGNVQHDKVGGGREPEQGGIRGEDREKSAIGGRESGSKSGEFDKDKSRSEPTSR